MQERRSTLVTAGLLTTVLLCSGCNREQTTPTADDSTRADAGGEITPEATGVPAFCADQEGRAQANLLFQLLPQRAASSSGGRSMVDNPVDSGLNVDALARHIDAVNAAASAADPDGVVKARYVAAMREGVNALQGANAADPSKLASVSEALTGAYLAFATPYACR